MRRLGFGLVGCGGAAADLCRAIDALPGVRVVAAYDHVEAAAQRLAAPRGAAVHADLETLLADPAVEAVYVGLPHDLLAPTAQLALDAGRHVLVEKPMAIALADVHRLDEVAVASGLVLAVMFELREAAAVQAARGLVAEGAIGDITAIRIRTVIDKPAAYWRTGLVGSAEDPWRASAARAGGGVLLMNTIHQLDLVRSITAEAFVRGAAEIATSTPGVDVEDGAAAILRLSGGGLVSIAASAHSPGAVLEERIELDGTRGRLDLPDPYGAGALRVYLRRPLRDVAADAWTEVPAPARDPHVELVRRFAGVVAAGRDGSLDGPRETALPGARDAAAALATVQALYRSAASGRIEPIHPWPGLPGQRG